MENILLLVVSILALVAFILSLLTIYNINKLIDEKNIIADFYRRKYEKEHAEKEEYKALRLQEVHINAKLEKALKEMDKLSKSQQYNSVKNLQNKMQSIIKELFIDGNQDK